MKCQKLPVIKYIFLYFTFVSSCMPSPSNGQTLGGNAAYNFLNLPATAQLSALGNVNISNISNDAGLAFNNPSLLRAGMHQQLHLSFNNMYAAVKNYHSYFAYRYDKWKTNFGAGVYYLDYGSLTQTDASGNILGSFHPRDYVVQLSASRQYENKWYYGASFKFIGSGYGLYRSDAIAMDIGISYFDTTQMFQASLLFKNMGMQLKQYQNSRPDDLPFDVQLGLTKKLAKAPIQFSLTAHHLHQFNIRYNDSSFNNSSLEPTGSEKSFTLDKIFRHFVLAAQVYAGSKIEITVAYNYLLRKELIIANTTNGFTGISLGIGVIFRKIQIRYARSHYQNNTAYNQLGVNLAMNEF
jgi:hypothetical protein